MVKQYSPSPPDLSIQGHKNGENADNPFRLCFLHIQGHITQFNMSSANTLDFDQSKSLLFGRVESCVKNELELSLSVTQYPHQSFDRN